MKKLLPIFFGVTAFILSMIYLTEFIPMKTAHRIMVDTLSNNQNYLPYEKSHNEYYTVYIPIIIGWLLGIASTFFLEKWKQNLQKKEIGKGIVTELSYNQIHLSSICYSTTFNYGIFNKEFLQWWKPYYHKLLETGDYDFLNRNKEMFDELFELDDSELQLHKEIVRQNMDPMTSHILTRISTPYIDSKIGSVSMFSEKYQSSILSIIKEINFINNDIEQVWYYFTKTFENPEKNNLIIINKNLNGVYYNIAKRSKGLVNMIEKFIKNYS